MSRAPLVALLSASLLISARAEAQVDSALELSSGLVRSSPTQTEPGFALSPSVAWRHGAVDLRVRGMAAGFAEGGIAADAEAFASLETPEWGCARFSTIFAGEVHRYPGGDGARRAEVGTRLLCGSSSGLAGWVGVGAGYVRPPSARSRLASQVDLGAAAGDLARGVTLSVRGVALPELPAVYRDTTIHTRNATERIVINRRILVHEAVRAGRYVDVTASGRWTVGRLAADFDVGTRLVEGVAGGERWGSGSLFYRVLPGLALGAGYGNTPSDPGLGLDRGRHFLVALRVTPEVSRKPAVIAPIPPPRLNLQIVPISAGRQALRLAAPAANSVEVAGDFSDWTPLQMERAGTVWETTVDLEPGVYRLSVRLDGGAWVAPAGLPTERDGFGGEVGVLAVPD